MLPREYQPYLSSPLAVVLGRGTLRVSALWLVEETLSTQFYLS